MKLPAILCVIASLAGCATAPQDGPEHFTVQIYNAKANRDEHIPVRLHFPTAQAAAKPAVIVMSGCDGELNSGARRLMEKLMADGVLIAELQSMRPFNRGSQCTSNNFCASTRAEEAFKARDVLVRRGLAREDNVGLLGFSHGGWTIAHAIFNETSFPYQPTSPFAVAVAYYPWCVGVFDVRSHDLKVPTLIFGGSEDTWTPWARCLEMEIRTREQSGPDAPKLEMVLYDGATHAFDSEKQTRTVPTHRGTALLKYDKRAASDSQRRALEMFWTHLRK